MKKLRIEELSIDSFETGGSGGAGTIAAYALTWECADNPDTRPSQDIMCTGGAGGGGKTLPCNTTCGAQDTSWGYTCDRVNCMSGNLSGCCVME